MKINHEAVRLWKLKNKDKVRESNKRWYRKNIKKIKIKELIKKDAGYYRDYYKKNAAKLRAQQAARRLQNPQKYRDAGRQLSREWRFRKYKISLSEYNCMVEMQGGQCGICKEKKKLYVDHCHETGKVRGLLCQLCNSGLGLMKDNIATLKNAIIYLNNAASVTKKK